MSAALPTSSEPISSSRPSALAPFHGGHAQRLFGRYGGGQPATPLASRAAVRSSAEQVEVVVAGGAVGAQGDIDAGLEQVAPPGRSRSRA
jgi:hypothetical protein